MRNLSVHIITLAFTLTLLGAFGTRRGMSSTFVHASVPSDAAARECPLQTAEEWQQFLETHAGNEKWVETCEDNSCDQDYARFVRENIQRMFERCAPFLAQHPALERCSSNMRRFTPAWLRQHDEDSYG